MYDHNDTPPHRRPLPSRKSDLLVAPSARRVFRTLLMLASTAGDPDMARGWYRGAVEVGYLCGVDEDDLRFVDYAEERLAALNKSRGGRREDLLNDPKGRHLPPLPDIYAEE